MKIVGSWNDLADYGIKPLTGEACGLMYRILFDVTERGKQIIEKCFDVKMELAEPWNRDAIGSIMLPHEMLVPLGIFALLESECREVWRNGETLIGIEQGVRNYLRRYACHGTAGSRNRHKFTGRVT